MTYSYPNVNQVKSTQSKAFISQSLGRDDRAKHFTTRPAKHLLYVLLRAKHLQLNSNTLSYYPCTQSNVLKYWAFSFQSCCVQWYLCSWGWTVANNYSGERWQGRAIFIHFNKTYISLNVANQCNIYTSCTVYLQTLVILFFVFSDCSWNVLC